MDTRGMFWVALSTQFTEPTKKWIGQILCLETVPPSINFGVVSEKMLPIRTLICALVILGAISQVFSLQ